MKSTSSSPPAAIDRVVRKPTIAPAATSTRLRSSDTVHAESGYPDTLGSQSKIFTCDGRIDARSVRPEGPTFFTASSSVSNGTTTPTAPDQRSARPFLRASVPSL
jgi:hypothetical protein